jgi:exodeoxyribonuclease III
VGRPRGGGGAGRSCQPRRLLHWNILDGGGSRLTGICNFVRGGQYDVLTLNELNGFDEASLERLGKRCGFTHSLLLAKSPYRLGILSRHPLSLLAADTGHTFAHGLLCARVLGLTLCVTHLNPHDVRRRADEAREIVRRVGTDDQQPFMLVGDLNTLSFLDRAEHAKADLASLIRKGPYAPQLSRKFLDSSQAAVDYTPMQVLLDAPLRDVGVGSGHSVPTSINADHMHFATLRLDYCLVNDQLLRSCGGQRDELRASLLHDERTDSLSDHYPLEVHFHAPPDLTR